MKTKPRLTKLALKLSLVLVGSLSVGIVFGCVGTTNHPCPKTDPNNTQCIDTNPDGENGYYTKTSPPTGAVDAQETSSCECTYDCDDIQGEPNCYGSDYKLTGTCPPPMG